MASEQQLSDVLSEFARTMVTDFPIQAILDRLVQRIVDVLPITSAGVTLITPGTEPRYVAASSDSALRFEELQTELSAGPCMAAYRTGAAVAVPDLARDERFPKFGPAALAAGLVAVFTFPLRHGDSPLGALDLYCDTPGPLNTATMTAAQTLADVAAAYLLNAQARSDLQGLSDQSRKDSLHDALTGLPNRTLLLERIARALLRGRRSGSIVALLFLDLDEFKFINDMYGHRTGDELLIGFAERLHGQLRPGDTLARLSGDEFVILCEDLTRAGEAHGIAARIGDILSQPFVISNAIVNITASIGIAFSGRADQIPEDLLHNADTAMYQAKRKGRGQQQIVDLDMQLVDEQARLRRDLRSACRAGELRLAYQPIVRAFDGAIIGAEALVRWAHPSQGIIPPAMFIPTAEQSGDIIEIGRWVLETACEDARRWSEHGLGMSVNVSASQILSANFTASVAEVLDTTGADPHLLTLEMTESVFIHESDRALIVLNDLKTLGLKLALDDFGKGYSSLNYLRRFPLDTVKIDQGFVAGMQADRASQQIVRAIVDLGHALGLKIVAEGVETDQQHSMIDELGCDACQGYHFARPMDADNFEALMSQFVTGSNTRFPLPVAPI